MTARDRLLEQYDRDAEAAAAAMAERLTDGDLHALRAAVEITRLAVGHPCTHPKAEEILNSGNWRDSLVARPGVEGET